MSLRRSQFSVPLCLQGSLFSLTLCLLGSLCSLTICLLGSRLSLLLSRLSLGGCALLISGANLLLDFFANGRCLRPTQLPQQTGSLPLR